MEKEKKKNGMGRLLEISMMKKGLMLTSVCLAVLSAIASFIPYLVIYQVIRSIVDVYPQLELLDSGRVASLGVMALLGVLANVVLYLLALACSHMAAYGTIYQLKIDFISHLAKVPLGFHIMTGSGKLRKIMDNNIEKLEGFIAHDLPNTVSAIVTPVIMLVLVFRIEWRLGLMVLLGIIVSFGLQGVTSGGEKTKRLIRQYEEALEDMAGASVEYVRGISVVKAFGQTSSSFKRLSDAIKKYMEAVIPYSLSQENMSASLQTALNSIYLFLLPMGIWMGTHTTDYKSFLAKFVFYLIFVPAISMIMMKVLYVMVNAQQSSMLIGRMDEVLSEPELVQDQKVQIPKTYDLSFEHVSFSYGTEEKSALWDVSFVAEPGTVTAIVGASGSGKSTIANLIPRFYDVKEGSIRIGGIDIRRMSTETLMDTVGFVFQDSFLFKQSILENIRMGRPSASKQEVIDAAKAARCHEFIESLPKGYETVYGKDGAHFSGGELQRIAIARAILQNTPILVLDEATAFSDPENEHLIQQALNELTKDKTVIMIAHRLSTVIHAGQILVMEKGALVEQGTHDELLKKNGCYCKLWKHYTQALTWKFSASGQQEQEVSVL